MTDNEIIKALECCRDNDNEFDMKHCIDECPYDGDCARKFMRDVLDLINRQQTDLAAKDDLLRRAEAYIDQAVKDARVEAVKAFANTLKAKKAIHFCKCGREFEYTEDINSFIDTEVEEYLKKKGIW